MVSPTNGLLFVCLLTLLSDSELLVIIATLCSVLSVEANTEAEEEEETG